MDLATLYALIGRYFLHFPTRQNEHDFNVYPQAFQIGETLGACLIITMGGKVSRTDIQACDIFFYLPLYFTVKNGERRSAPIAVIVKSFCSDIFLHI